MPQFYPHTPTSQGDMAAIRKASRASKQVLPIGIIGEGINFSWGYNGEFYFVSEGVLEYLVTRIHLTLEEAGKLFEALNFTESSEPCQQTIFKAIKTSRKEKLIGDKLMWFFVDALSINNQ